MSSAPFLPDLLQIEKGPRFNNDLSKPSPFHKDPDYAAMP